MKKKHSRRRFFLIVIFAVLAGFLLGVELLSSATSVFQSEINGTRLYMNDTSGLEINGSVNITGMAYYNGSLICTASNGLCTTGGANNYPTSLAVTNGSTHTITIGRNGLGNLEVTFDDQNSGGGGAGIITVQSLSTSLLIVNGSTSTFDLNKSDLTRNFGNYTANASTWGICNAGFYSRWNGTGLSCFIDNTNVGTVTQVDTGTWLTGGSITSTGTISADTAAIRANIGNFTGNASTWSLAGVGNYSAWNGTGFNSLVLPIDTNSGYITWRLVMPQTGTLQVNNNTGVQLKAGTGMSLTNDTFGNVTIATTITQYTDTLAGDAAAARLQNTTILRNFTDVNFTRIGINNTGSIIANTTCTIITNPAGTGGFMACN